MEKKLKTSVFLTIIAIMLQVNLRSGDYVEEFGTENIVFLAAESPNVLTGSYCI